MLVITMPSLLKVFNTVKLPYLEVAYHVKRQPHKMVKYTQTIRRLLLTNCLSVFDGFAGLALIGLKLTVQMKVALRPCEAFFIINGNITTNSAEKDCFVVLNLKSKIIFKTF